MTAINVIIPNTLLSTVVPHGGVQAGGAPCWVLLFELLTHDFVSSLAGVLFS